MRITYKGDYALKTILDLSLHYGNSPVAIHELASRADIPIKFLEQILLELKRGGFVESRRGKVGGYLLAKKPKDITLGDVVRYIDGPLEPIVCVKKDYKGCKDISRCVFKNIWKKVAVETSKIIDGVTFEELSARARQCHEASAYQI